MAGWSISENEKNLFQIVRAIIQILQGRSNAVGTVTLRANQATTIVDKSVSPGALNVAEDSIIHLSPKTANAAVAKQTAYVSLTEQGGFVITHANNAQTDKTFGWSAHG